MSDTYVLIAKVLAATALVALLLFGVQSCQEHYRDQGRDEVRAQWDATNLANAAAFEKDRAEKERTEREKEQRMAKAAEEKALEQARLEEDLRRHAAELERSNGGLRSTVARLEANSRARRAAGTCPAATAEADEATTARSLLSACTGRYIAMEQDAGKLAAQVIGLQDHVVVVQPDAKALLHEDKP